MFSLNFVTSNHVIDKYVVEIVNPFKAERHETDICPLFRGTYADVNNRGREERSAR